MLLIAALLIAAENEAAPAIKPLVANMPLEKNAVSAVNHQTLVADVAVLVVPAAAVKYSYLA
jgi:hypothetical protein